MKKSSDQVKIMIVDEDTSFVKSSKLALEKAGYFADCYDDFREALLAFKPSRYSVILLGVRMKKVNSFDLARELWRQQPGATICFLSNFEIPNNEAKMVFRSLRNPRFMKRPATPRALLTSLQRLQNDMRKTARAPTL